MENSYTVPQVKKFNKAGQCAIKFSTELQTVSYEEIKRKFGIFYETGIYNDNYRKLRNGDEGGSGLTE